MSGSTYCRPCKARSVARKKLKEQERPTAAERGYDKDWRRVRGAYIKAHPTCEQRGCQSRTEEVHHMKPLREGGERLKWSNLMGLCSYHHKKHEANYNRGEGGRFSRR